MVMTVVVRVVVIVRVIVIVVVIGHGGLEQHVVVGHARRRRRERARLVDHGADVLDDQRVRAVVEVDGAPRRQQSPHQHLDVLDRRVVHRQQLDLEVLEVLRQPLEEGQVTLSRAAVSLTYPARCMLVAPTRRARSWR